MSKKNEINENYWKMVKRNQIREDYERYLTDTSSENDLNSAHIFAMLKIKESGSDKYFDHTERQIIHLLCGKLPDLYD